MKKIGIYPGSFNPLHKGHKNIIEKSKNLFDDVILVKATNPDKTISSAPIIDGMEVIEWPGMIHDLVKKLESERNSKVFVIKGLRNAQDFDNESTQLKFMQDFYPDIQVVFIKCDREFEHISSSAIRSISKFDVKLAEQYL